MCAYKLEWLDSETIATVTQWFDSEEELLERIEYLESYRVLIESVERVTFVTGYGIPTQKGVVEKYEREEA